MARSVVPRRTLLAVALLVVVAAAVPVRPGEARAAAPAQTPVSLGPVRIVPTGPGAKVTVHAVFPQNPNVCQPNQPQDLTAAYPGTLEVGRRANGDLYLITELSFSDYLKGIAEVPTSWPLAALEAQVVAARTYAISHMNSGTIAGVNYNLCSTDACQVYRGLGVQDGPYGEEWTKAVDDTAGQILEYQGTPIDALYFSTSNGHTYSNADVFGGTPLPYLKPVVENDDSQSDTSRWSVTMPLSDLAQVLTLGGLWDGRAIDTVALQGDTVAISGSGKSIAPTLSTFRNALNNNADCLTPRRYPSPATGGGRLPQTVPSLWVQLSQQGSSIVMTGRGWGHGVGMVQYGAEGKANRGLGYQDILAYYYGGLRPVKVTEPGSIRVLLATGVQQVTIVPSGPTRVDGAPAVAGALTITGGAVMTVAGGGSIAPTLSVSDVTTTASAMPGAPAVFSFSLNHAANVGLTYAESAGVTQGAVPAAPFTGGGQTLPWDPLGAGLPEGTYDVALVADDGVSRVVSPTFPVGVHRPAPSPSPSPPASARPTPQVALPNAGKPRSSPPAWLPLGVGAGFLLVLAAAVVAGVLTRRRGPGGSGGAPAPSPPPWRPGSP